MIPGHDVMRGEGGGVQLNVTMTLFWKKLVWRCPLNEAEHTTGIVWKVRREERLRRCEVGVTVVRWCCHTHTGNEVSSCVGRVVERLRSLCVFWPCGCSAALVGLLWVSGGLLVASQHLVESLRHRMVVLWVWHGPFFLA